MKNPNQPLRMNSFFLKTYVLVLFTAFAVCHSRAAALSGTYTICASGCDYADFSAAFTDLKSKGISSAVTFNVSAGTYTGGVSISSITGVSATNTITFNGAGMNSTIWSSSSGTYVLSLGSVNYVSFKNIQFNFSGSSGEAISILGPTGFTLANCRVIVPNYATTGSYVYGIYAWGVSNCAITNSRIEGGYYSCYSAITSNFQITRCKMVGFYYAGLMSSNRSGTGQDVFSNNVLDSSTGTTSNNYGIQASNEDGFTCTNNILNNCIFEILSPNINSTSRVTDISNNIIYTPTTSYGSGFYIYAQYANVRIDHNTVYFPSTGSTGYGVYISSAASKGAEVMNNIFDIEGSASYNSIYISGSASNYSKLEGNDYYTGSGSSLASTSILGTAYTTFSSLQTALKTYGFETYGNSLKPTYLSLSKHDLHLDKTVANPLGLYAGIDKDIDGDLRCQLFPSAGADESTYGRTTKGTAKYYGPDTIYFGSPVTFYNAAKPGAYEKYRWYVNNVHVSDSVDLVTTITSGDSIKVTLAVVNCAGIDSTPIFFPTAYPSKATVADFIADKNVVKQDDIVHFSDASTNAPSAWQWNITPAYTIINGINSVAYKFLYGTTAASQNPVVQFLGTGSYKVCLSVTNKLKSGNTGSSSICRTAYVSVVASINLGSQASTNVPKGYIYDDGGPNGNYYSTSTYPKPTVQGLTIDACADSTYLVFQSFGTYCGYDYVKVYDGKDNTGKQLTKTCSSGLAPSSSGGYWVNGPGYTGGGSYPSCTYTCLPNLSTSGGKVDTFKAGKQMYIEMDMYPGFTNPGIGFSAYYWTKPTSATKPKARFITSRDASHDSICEFGSIGFINKSMGSNVTYLWDLDNNLANGFESISQNPSWSYPFAGKDTVRLITVNCGGTDTFTKVITVFPPIAPKVGFSVNDQNPALDEAVLITSGDPICVDTYKWRIFKTYKSATDTGRALFISGTSTASTNPMIMFSDTGYYTVVQVLENIKGKDSLLKPAYIQVRPAYCKPDVNTVLADIGISYVGIQNINNKSSQGVADYTSYVNDLSQSAYMQLGFNYVVTVKRDSAFFSAITRTIYIDWQHNGNFVKAAVDSNNNTTATWNARINVPKNAKTGSTVMRVAANLGSLTNYPCGTNQYGEYEDYRVYIIPDTVAPVIILKGSDTIAAQRGYQYVEPGYKAVNSSGIDISSKVIVTPVPASLNVKRLKTGTYVLAYNVTDSFGNKAITRYRYLVVTPDVTPPVLQVSGPDTTIVAVDTGSTGYAKLPAVISAYDAADSVVSVTISPQKIPVNKLDTIKVQYSATDSSGNKTTVYRYIIIKDNIAPLLKLKGNALVTVRVNTTYKDAGATATDNYYTTAKLDSLIVPVSNLDMTKLGSYTITYTLTDPSGNVAVPVKRTVTVVDSTPPQIRLNGNLSDTIEVNTVYVDYGVNTSDNYYTTVTVTKGGTFYSNFPSGKATKLGVFTIIYIATDGAGNADSVTRTVAVVDRISPVITLLGDTLVNICRWADYKDTGYQVSDNYYTLVKIDTLGTFITGGHTQLPGIYSLRYKATDGSGNVSYSAYRVLVVLSDTTAECKSGIKEGLALDKYVSVYPNPTTGLLTISADLPYQRNVQVYVTNSLGQRVGEASTISLGRNTFNIDLSAQAAGLYMLNIVSDKEKIAQQIMLTK